MPNYPSIFNDVIGPVMRGPSSSHCAASLRIARICRDLMEEKIKTILIEFDPNGSLATTHKSQGSEENSVLFVVADRDEYWCDRSLVYVAASRAKKSLRVNGSDAQLRQIVARPAAKPSDLIALRLCA